MKPMKPRIEQKIEFAPSEYASYLRWLSRKCFQVKHQQRIVSSIYFDNDEFMMFHHTRDGITPRKKIRLRTYFSAKRNAQLVNNYYALETKISTEVGRQKSTVEKYNPNPALDSGIFDSMYGRCTPAIKIQYTREYYQFQQYRVTIDKNIEYERMRYSIPRKHQDPSFVLEIKTGADENLSELRNFFEFPRSQFSKYERGVEALFFI